MKNNKQPGRVKSALLNWLGVPISLTTGTFWEEWFGTSKRTHAHTAESWIALSAVTTFPLLL
ncbi:phage portal protein, partial [Escherichia sp. TWPC-MK]